MQLPAAAGAVTTQLYCALFNGDSPPKPYLPRWNVSIMIRRGRRSDRLDRIDAYHEITASPIKALNVLNTKATIPRGVKLETSVSKLLCTAG